MIADLEELVQEGLLERYDRLRRFIYAMRQHPIASPPSLPPPCRQYHSHSVAHSLPASNRPSPLNVHTAAQPFSSGTHFRWISPLRRLRRVNADIMKGRLTFKESPFYKILEPLTSVVECKGKIYFYRTYSCVNLASDITKCGNKHGTM